MSKIKKNKKSCFTGIANIKTTFNNTIITINDLLGNTLCWASSGSSGFKGARKNTPFAAQSAAKNVALKAIELGMEKSKLLLKEEEMVEKLLLGLLNRQD